MQALRAFARAEAGGLDILVANAGAHGFATVGDTSDDDWAASLRGNLTTALVSIRELLPELVARRGAVVAVSSLAGLFAGPEAAGYVTTKHALLGLVRSVARDYGPRGVRANAVCPGWVRTPMADEEMEVLRARHGLDSAEAAYALATRNVPLRRPAEPGEVASVIAFLASPDAAMVNGVALPVDGGSAVVDVPTIGFAD
jgi:NAD(P)-dependent dehydrogenase (short-subunit alcohol dehydrogenase family)